MTTYAYLVASGVTPETADEIAQACPDKLTARCAILAAQGMTQEEIAAELGVDQPKVSRAFARIAAKIIA